jgi:hypothetical protein
MTDANANEHVEAPPRLQVVGGGNGWWAGPGPSSIATYVFVDVEAFPDLLNLPQRAAEPGIMVEPAWLDGGRALRLTLSGERPVTVEIDLDRPELEAVRRARRLFVCPTTPKLGLDPYLARDLSVAVELPPLPKA